VVDAGGNTVTSLSTGNVTVTATGLTATNGTAAITNGVATFSGLSFTGTAGSYTLSFSDGTNSVTQGFTLTPGAASQLLFTTTPSASAAYGTALAQQPVVRVADAGGNTLTSLSTGTITVTASGLTATNGTASITNGVATFSNLSFTGTATGYTLSFSDGTRSVTNAFTLTPGAAAGLAFTTTPSASAAYGTALAQQPVVAVVDAGGNTVTSLNTGSISVSASGLTPTGGTASIVNGVATFTTLSFTGIATGYTLSFTDGTNTVTNGFTLTPGAPAAITINTQPAVTSPAGGLTGNVLDVQPVITVVDAGGNPVGAGINVLATLNQTGGGAAGSLTGTATLATNSSGQITWSLSIIPTATGEMYTITFTNQSGSGTNTSGTITIP
ncbi:MAG: hypothetical protein HY275_06760, partial [Gemmatimonadetes bacterium]|nr:hypothetical protein [Gemmatimonadota bacterium]